MTTVSNLLWVGALLVSSGDALVSNNNNNNKASSSVSSITRLYNGLNNNDVPNSNGWNYHNHNNNGRDSRQYMSRGEWWQESPATDAQQRRRPATRQERLVRSDDNLIRHLNPQQNPQQPVTNNPYRRSPSNAPWEQRRSERPNSIRRSWEQPERSTRAFPNQSEPSPRRPDSPWERHTAHNSNRQSYYDRPSTTTRRSPYQPSQQEGLVRTPRHRRPRRDLRSDYAHNIGYPNNNHNPNDYMYSGPNPYDPPQEDDPQEPLPPHPLEEKVKLLQQQMQDLQNEKEQMLTTLLDVQDNLDRAVRMAAAAVAAPLNTTETLDHEKALGTLKDGIQLTHSKLGSALEQGGLTKYGQVGEEFDPQYHNALFTTIDKSKPAGTIGHVVQNGYVLKQNGQKDDKLANKKKVLRYAQVSVVKEEEYSAEDEEENDAASTNPPNLHYAQGPTPPPAATTTPPRKEDDRRSGRDDWTILSKRQ